jgi:glycosyltransferase involved in cell wall biosynthesis
MRIAMFQDTFRPKVDGIVVSTELFSKELRKRGHEVMVFAPKHPDFTYNDLEEDTFLIDAVKTDFLYPGVSLGKFWKGNLGEIFAKRKPDLIHSQTEFTIGHWMASYWKSKLDVPRVHTFHTLWTEYLFYLPVPEFVSQPFSRWLAPRLVNKRFNAVIAPTEKMAEAVRDDWNVHSPVDVVPTGIDLSQFSRMDGGAFRAEYGIRPEDKVVLYLGRLGTEKNVELVINTFGELQKRGEKNLRFVVAGGGPDFYVEKLKKMAAEQGIKDIIWTGFVRGQQWLNTYGAADIVLFPSITETQGLVVVEALAAGKPLVSVEAMGPASTMKGERGCLFADNDTQKFADATARLLHDEVLYSRKKKEALDVARGCSIEQRTDELLAVYERILGRTSAASSQPDRRAAI